MSLFKLDRAQTALLIVDVQDKVFSAVERSEEVIDAIFKIVRGAQILNIPMIISEQNPQGLGPTLLPLKTLLGDAYRPHFKSSFSCMSDRAFKDFFNTLPFTQWIVVGLESHICVLQTVRDLLNAQKHVVVLNDAIASRSIFDFSTAIAEMRDMGARISSVETVLFELLQDANSREFKEISHLVKTKCCCS